MENQPSISIIVPCYNQAQYLDECLQSVLDQTYQNWECIIVNDGSPDNTEEVAKKWIERDSRFKYLYKENGGLSSARNAGIEKASGEWILPLDCDDKISSDYLQLAAQEFDNGYTIIYCNAAFFGKDVGPWEIIDYTFDDIIKQNIIFCSAFFKKTSWNVANGYDTNLIYGREDWDFWLSILDQQSLVFKISKICFFYRRKTTSMDLEFNQDNLKKIYSENYIYKKHLQKYLPYSNSAIDNYKTTSSLIKDQQHSISNFNKAIYKNFFTWNLFKIIKKL